MVRRGSRERKKRKSGIKMGKLLITGLTGVSGSAFYDVLCRRRYPGKIKVVVRKTTNCEVFRNTPLDLWCP